jgi:hypothetical protein
MFLFSVIAKNFQTGKEEIQYILFDFYNKNPKYYKFGIVNKAFYGAKFYVKNDIFYAKLNKEITFTLKDGKLLLPEKVINKKDYLDEYIFSDDKRTNEEIYETFKPYVEEFDLDLNDPLISSKKDFEIYKHNKNGDKIIKEVETPLGKFELTNSPNVNLNFYPKENPKLEVPLVNIDSLEEKFPGVLAVNSTKTLILTYFAYNNQSSNNKTCGEGLVLFDMSGESIKATSFGARDACFVSSQ